LKKTNDKVINHRAVSENKQKIPLLSDISATSPPPSFLPFASLCHTSAFVYIWINILLILSTPKHYLPLLQKYEHCLRYYSNRLSSDEDVLFFGVFFVFFVFFFSFFLLSGWSEFFFEDGDDAKIVVVVVSDFAD